jgi:alginate O-acetyltransferase complex protein AlgI
MLFHTQLFLVIFLPITFLGYLAAARIEPRWGALPRKLFLLAASLVFYAYWDVRLAPVLVGSVLVNWLILQLSRPGQRGLVVFGVAANLTVLALFKYADFVASNLADVFGTDHVRWEFALPLGISFYTFQQISCLVDRQRGTAPRYSLVDYALYVSFFPQLVAGPIVRHDELVPQFARPPLATGAAERMGRGLTLLAVGLARKVFIADPLGDIADPLFAAAGSGGAITFAESWFAALGFALQIYFDFSAYSDMAIGLALMFGFRLPVNFNAPYRAWSVGEFWRRWHMTLSRFLRDYLYFPLGGSRGGTLLAIRNTLITMLLSGLWHGAAWTFVAWGGLHGLAMACERIGRRLGLSLPRPAGWALTFLFVVAAFVLFRATSFEAAATIYGHMIGLDGFSLDFRGDGHHGVIPVALAIVLLLPPSQKLVLEWLPPRPWAAAATAAVLIAGLLQIGVGANEEFIYFQF